LSVRQLSFAASASRDLGLGPTRRERILREIDRLVDWPGAVARCAPHWPAPPTGRRPTPLEPLIRLAVLRELWQVRSTDALLEFVADSDAARWFVGVDLLRDRFPARSTIDRFGQLMREAGVLDHLVTSAIGSVALAGYRIEAGTVDDPRLIAVAEEIDPGSRRSRKGARGA
jgi:IS5 family transposase